MERPEIDGLAALDRYGDTGDPRDLHAAARAFGQVLTVRPDHPDRGRWASRLSAAFTDRAGDSGLIEDHDAAIAWTGRLLAALPVAGEDGDDLLVRFADLLWNRAWTRCETAPEHLGPELDRLVRRLTALAGRDAGPVARGYVGLLLGTARDEQMNAGVGDHLDEVVAALAPALETLAGQPPDHRVDADQLAAAAGTLAMALVRRAGRDESPPDLDRAVAVLERALHRHASRPGIRTDLAARLAFVLQQRWHARTLVGDPAGAAADLDAGIAAARLSLQDGNPWLSGLLGELLSARAEQNGSTQDARAAVRALERAAGDAAGDPDSWHLWSSAAAASRLIPDDPEALAATARFLDRALALAVPDDDRLRLHTERVTAGHLLVNAGRPEPAGVLRGAVDAGIRTLWRAGRADPRRRSAAALALAYGSFAAAGADLGEVDGPGITALLRLAAEHPDSDAQWQAMVDYGTGVIEHYAAMMGAGGAADSGLGSLARAAAFADPSADFAQRLRYVVSFAGQAQSAHTGSRTAGQTARRQAAPDRPLPDRPAPPGQAPVSPSDHQIVAANAELMELLQAGDTAGAAAAARTWLPILTAAGLSGMDLTFLQMLRAIATLDDPHGSAPLTVPGIEATGGLAAHLHLAGAMVTASAVLAQAVAHGDLGRLRETADRIEDLVASAPGAAWRVRVGALTLAAQAHLEIAHRAPAATGAAVRAAGLFGAAMKLSGGVGFPLWSQLTMGRAGALRLTGGTGPAQARAHGLSALQGHAWQVFAQSGTDNSIAAARQAAADARTVAAWCLADHEAEPAALEQLVAALDAGRGLVLRAAATSRLIADRLARAGHPGLARDWQATAGQGADLVSGLAMPGSAGAPSGTEIPDDLRLKVLRALGTGEVAGYEQIDTAQIRSALTAVGSDALVYLVAPDRGGDGAAVIVPATGAPRVIRLPRLHLGPVRRFLSAQPQTAPAAAVADGPADREVRTVAAVTAPGTGLEDLCAWAWDAAMGAVLGAFPARPARLVLVPMGMLGLVPWHAAFDRRSPRIRYAAQDAVISYTPSARTLCTLAGHRPGGIPSALIVGNPTGDLRFAGYEAQAVRDTFYPRGTYFGRPAEEATAPGSPADVLDWITTRPSGPVALHFACHGAVDPRFPADAHLALAGPAHLTVRTLLERSQTAALDVQEVFLAACTTSVGGHDHDEVLSLATSFLAAGARTAFGSLWPVPDTHTSLLMIKVHQHLRRDGLAPADALHRAQLWMLDPDRETADLPPRLRRRCRPGQVFPLASWAGFIHTGR